MRWGVAARSRWPATSSLPPSTLPEPRVGLIAGAGGIHRLVRQVPLKQAMGMLLTGKQITAQEAYRIGLVNEVVPLAELMATPERWAGEILEGSP
jgi:enoyl-CoA hydratase/carnithine racemase